MTLPNPTAPDEVLPALADISAYLYNDQDTDPLIKAALVHYQFEMIHPFEQYNGIVGRILATMVLSNTIGEALRLLSLSEYLYNNKNEYFDLLTSTQYSGGYIRWIKFFVNAIRETAKQSAGVLEQYERIIAEGEKHLIYMRTYYKSIVTVYEHLKRFPITNISYTANRTGLSFNSISKALTLLQENGVVSQKSSTTRNRLWEYGALLQIVDAK